MNKFIAVSLLILLTPIAFPLALLYVVCDIWRCWLEVFIGDSISGAETYEMRVKRDEK